MPYDVFISHSSYDSKRAFDMCSFLEYHVVKCWIAFLLGFKYIRRYVKSLTNSMLKLDGIES